MVTSTDRSKPRRLIIHCGVQKTGSTSFHHFVGRNRAVLADRVEILTPAKGSITRDLGRAATGFSLDPTAENRDGLAAIAQQLRDQLLAGALPALISHENLPGAMLGNRGVATLYPQLENILGILDAAFAPMLPEYVFYTRQMASWKRSVHNQAVRSDSYAAPRETFLAETDGCGTWDDLRDRLLARLGAERLRVFALEDETDDTRPAQQLLRHAGLSGSDIAGLSPVAGRSNPSLNAGALEFLRLVNGMGLDRRTRSRVADLVFTQQSLFVSG